MSDIKNAMDKTEELTRQIWLAGLGAYGQSVDNFQGGYDKMNDQARRIFDDLVARGEKIETEAKEILDQASDRIKGKADKIKAKADKIKAKADKIKAKPFKVDGFEMNINDRLGEIRSKVSGKVTMPSFGNDAKIEELSQQIADLQKAVEKLSKAQKKPAATKKTSNKAKA